MVRHYRGPGSGKTTTINILAKRNYHVTIEHARHYIDTQRIGGKSVMEIRSNQREFQQKVLAMQLEQERSMSPEDTVFLDRAIPDSLAYYRFMGLEPDEKLNDALKTVSYKKVFILDVLPLVNDYARSEDAAAQKRIHQLLIDVYSSLPFPVVRVPVMPPEERVDFILENIESLEKHPQIKSNGNIPQ
ncbi:AAA family ATPase [Chitinophaga oryzae]|uniref:AAA family ATPase n=1 Tax=Chitinophaga oryzae TaxID=2725414 RepID=UPI001C65917B|nr:ATP-binding protein [Chitinophaga oryzae]